MTPYLNWICNSEQWNECWKDVFGEIGVGSFLGDEHHVGEDKRDHVVVGALLAEARKHSLHVHSLQQRTLLSGYRFLFRHSLFRQFLFGRKSIHASDVRNCHCTFGDNFISTLFGSAYFGQMRISHTFPAYPHYMHIFPAYSRIFSPIVGAYLGIFWICFAHISCLYTAHIWEIVTRFSGFPRYTTHSLTGFPA